MIKRSRKTTAKALAVVAFFAALGSCYKSEDHVLESIHASVDHREIETVRRLAPLGVGMEDVDEVGATPLISAASSDQFIIAEILIANGANIWAYDRFGVTAGRMIDISKTPPDSDEGKARLRVKATMQDLGFPFPTPKSREILDLAAQKKWPPLPAKMAR